MQINREHTSLITTSMEEVMYSSLLCICLVCSQDIGRIYEWNFIKFSAGVVHGLGKNQILMVIWNHFAGFFSIMS